MAAIRQPCQSEFPSPELELLYGAFKFRIGEVKVKERSAIAVVMHTQLSFL